MGTRSRGPLAGFGWLASGIQMGFDHPKQIFGAAAVMLVASLIPTAITLPVQFHAQQMGTQANPAMIAWSIGVPFLFSLLLLPLHAGFLQLIDAAEHGLHPRVGSIFSLYGKGEAWRVIGYGLALIALYAAVIGIVIVASGGGIVHWYAQALNARTNHLPPPTGLPDGFGVIFASIMAFVIFLMGFHSIALGQIAQCRRSVFGAIGDGIIGALKNMLPLVMLAVGGMLAGTVTAIGVIIIAMLLVFIGKLISVWLVFAFLIPLYIALAVFMSAFIYGVMYHIWRDVCGDNEAPSMAEPLAA